jgi:cobalt-zinc-cadmium efflux system protein
LRLSSSIILPILLSGAGLLLILIALSLLPTFVNVLLEGAPPHLDVSEIESALCAAPGVQRVHDLHVWTLTSGRDAMSAHVVVAPDAPAARILENLHVILHTRFGIDHTTIQIDTEPARLLRITSSPRS